ncbi:unnamed protein product [Ectocarpus sp. CCAP 1310/34]|nr:unnamed protein product [Ectocarpus sp. CCAP 1310/34]
MSHVLQVAKLMKAKQHYKEVTGSDYVPPPQEKKAKSTPKPQGDVPPSSSGPSKNAAKKAEKAAKKAAAKGAKSAPVAGSCVPPAAAPAPAASRSSLPSMYLGSDGSGPLKCLTAAKFFGVEVEVADTNPAGELSSTSGCAVSTGMSVIFGSNAVCRYFSYKGKSSSPKGPTTDPAGAVEEWLDWETGTLAPAQKALAASKEAGGSVPTEALAALKHLEDKLTGTWLLEGDEPSLADIVVGVTAQAAITVLGEAEATSTLAKVLAYAQRVGEMPACKQAASTIDTFIKASAREQNASTGVSLKAGLQASLLAMFDAAMFKAWPLAKSAGITSSSVRKCADYKNGDFQCNAAMALFKALKGGDGAPSSPQAAASAIVASLPVNPLVDTTSVSPQGYINIRLRPAFINQSIAKVIKNGPAPPEVKKMRVVVDFSSPNIAKEMHVGHLRSTIIGEAICRVLEFCGHTVFRHNHVGDWGTQFGMLINYMKEAYPNFLTDPPNITDLTTFYKAAKLRFDESEEFKEASRNTVVDLQSGDPACKEVWTLLCDISRKEFQKVYDRLDVTLEEHGESFYNDMIPSTIDMLAEAGLVSRDDGADIVRLEHFTYPLIVRKRDGGFGYDSTDMTAIRYRLKTLKCDWIIGITDAGQASHFHMCFDAARAAGWVDEGTKLEHLGFGVVLGPDGKKYKTRSGDTVRLVDLLDEAVRRMAASIQERMDEGKMTTTKEAAAAAAAEIGYGAVKYYDLRQHPSTSYVFSYDRMLDTRGNTAVYLQFAHARLASILLKAQDELHVDVTALKASPEKVSVEHESERALAFELLMFSDVIEACLADLGPNRLCEYLHTLATKFTDFVTNCRVLGSDGQTSRLLLCEATGVTMRKCFSLLGMKALDRI